MASEAAVVKPITSRDDWILRGAMVFVIGSLVLTILLPLYFFLSKSFQNADREFNGIANYIRYINSPGLVDSIGNSFFVAGLSTAISVTLAFAYAFALTRSCIPGKTFFRVVAFFPMLAPSLLPAISFVYFFGTQGIIKEVLFGHEIYGPIGRRHGFGVLHLSPRLHHHSHRAFLSRMRGCMKHRSRCAPARSGPFSRSPCPALSTV